MSPLRHSSEESGMQDLHGEVPPPSPRSGEPAVRGGRSQCEEAYLQFGPLLRKIAVGKFGIPAQDVEPLVHDVFATYFLRWRTVEMPERYLFGAICNASRKYCAQADAAGSIFCGETPCAATPSDALLREVNSKVLLSRILRCVGD